MQTKKKLQNNIGRIKISTYKSYMSRRKILNHKLIDT